MWAHETPILEVIFVTLTENLSVIKNYTQISLLSGSTVQPENVPKTIPIYSMWQVRSEKAKKKKNKH